MPPTMLVDGNNILLRAIKGMEHAGLTGGGAPTGALMVFVNSLSRHIREERPRAVMVCWDGGRSEFRTALYPGYKGSRERRSDHEGEHSPFTMVKEFLHLAGIPSAEEGGWEADDLIGAYWRAARAAGEPVVIISSDHDLLQLVDAGTVQVKVATGRNETDRWDATRVLAEHGCAPEFLPMVMALRGDPGDCVPGLDRVGPKRAVKMLQAVGWSWDRLLDSLGGRDRDLVELSLSLVDLREGTLVRDLVPTPRLTTAVDPIYPALLDFVRRYQLRRIEQAISTGTLWGDQTGSWR